MAFIHSFQSFPETNNSLMIKKSYMQFLLSVTFQNLDSIVGGPE